MSPESASSQDRFKFDRLPFEEDVERFAPPYSPEVFIEEELFYLKPFFSNTDRPVYVVKYLPEEVTGALSSRYSRSITSLRRTFLTEYVWPIAHPEQQKIWDELESDKREEVRHLSSEFFTIVSFFNSSGGVDHVVNIQRARGFFDKWLAQYGDDSIAEMGGAHVCIEGMSNVTLEELVNKRIGISPLIKSTRYVSFSEKRPDGEYQYVVPGEIRGTNLEQEYREAMDTLFDTYTRLNEPYLEYIKNRFPQAADETETSFKGSRSAKRFDDLRDLLPFSTQINGAFFGNGRAFEDLINRLMDHPLGELRYWGQTINRELEEVVPSFVRRPKTERGAEIQRYRSNIKKLRQAMTNELLVGREQEEPVRWVRLVNRTQDADVIVLSSFLFSGEHVLSLREVTEKVRAMPYEERVSLLARILEERKFAKPQARREEVRFRKVPRAFENAHYLFEIWGRGGDFRDLHRHRMNTEEHKPFSVEWGFDLEKEVLESPFIAEIRAALEKAARVSSKIRKQISPEVAQYAVPFAYIQHWYMNLSAREIYWIGELRTSSQGRPHYREIVQQIGRLASEATPEIFQLLMIDWEDYSLARRESEKKIEAKLKSLNS